MEGDDNDGGMYASIQQCVHLSFLLTKKSQVNFLAQLRFKLFVLKFVA